MKVTTFYSKTEAFSHFLRLQLLKTELAREMEAFKKDVKLSEFLSYCNPILSVESPKSYKHFCLLFCN